jgi:hypothetical protein
MHTKDFLAGELRKAGLNSMAEKAATGYYHDFLSPLAMPCQQLAHDLTTFANAPSLSEPRRLEVRGLLARHLNGEFDASQEESKAWAASDDGRETFAKLMPEDGPKARPDAKEQSGRLAMRHEGEWWSAYYADHGTMEGAILLGSILMKFAENPERKRAFMDLMRDNVADMIEAVTGQRPVWPTGPEPAPEHERSGHA